MITGSIIGSAVLGAGGSFLAGKAQKEASEEAADELARQFNVTRRQLKPFRETGTQAFQQLGRFAGVEGTRAEKLAIREFQESPGQIFLRERAERSLVRNAAKLGGIGGGNIRQALQEQAIGIASQQLGQRFGQLAGLAQTGFAAAGQLGQFRQSQATQQAGLLQQQGAARAGQIAGVTGAFQSGIGGLTRFQGFQSGLQNFRRGQASADLDVFQQNSGLF